MKGLERIIFISCNILNLISYIYTQNVSTKVLGESACVYWGPIDIGCQDPSFQPIPFSDLPKECSAFMFDGLYVYPNFTVVTGDFNYDDEFIQGHLNAGHKVFAFLERVTNTLNDLENHPWERIFKDNIEMNIENEINGFGGYFKDHPKFTGLILGDFEYGHCSNVIAGYTDKVIMYVKKLKEAYPEFKIGMILQSKFITDYYSRKDRLEWLDFTLLDSFFDFYIFGFYGFNTCTEDKRNGGTVPINGKGKYTLEKLQQHLLETKISKDKIYLEISVVPKAPPKIATGFPCISYEEICNKTNISDKLCADTEETYREKGKFAKLHVSGFIAGLIDFDDPHMHCKCGRPYPSFHTILDGWNNAPPYKPCDLFNRK